LQALLPVYSLSIGMVELLPLAQCQLQKNDLGDDRSGN
jgi:hypothetical protein